MAGTNLPVWGEESLGGDRPLERTPPPALPLALALGALGALLGIDGPWGINATVLLVLLAGVGAYGWRRTCPEEERGRWIGFGGAAIFALGFTSTENSILRTLDGAAILVCLSLPLLRPAGAAMGALRPVVLGHALLESMAHFAVGGLRLVLRRIEPLCGRDARAGQGALLPILAGVGIALGLVMVFGSLLRASDAVFDDWVGRRIDPEWLGTRAVVSLGVGVLFAGSLQRWFARPSGDRSPFPPADPVQLAPQTVLIPLATLVLLFGGFVAVQAGYISPAEHPAPGKLAGIARRGFFELVAVGGLALLVLLAADSCLRYSVRGVRTVYTVIAAALLVLVAAILASAVWRMQLYIEHFGLTELRLFASTFLLWTAFALTWFALTVLRGVPRRFTSGALIAALALGGALHAVSPEAMIVASHLDPPAGRDPEREPPTDWGYLSTRGVDAIPAIVARWDRIPEGERPRLLAQWARVCDDDRPWTAWTLARRRAESAMSRL